MKMIVYRASWLFLCCIVFVIRLDCTELNPVETGRHSVFETRDGMIIAGMVESASNNIATVRTKFGVLNVPYIDIERIDGDRYEMGQGILREHSITIQNNGDALVDYTVPVSYQQGEQFIRILVIGKVVSLKDIYGRPLLYSAQEQSGFTRCVVTVPEYLLPAVRVVVLQEKVVKELDDGTLQYDYRYTPRTNQNFRLQVTLPSDTKSFEATPADISSVTRTLLWNISLRKQETELFNLKYVTK